MNYRMGTIVKKIAIRVSLCSLFLVGGSAKSGAIGSASINDVTLDGAHAIHLHYSNGVNSQSHGRNGSSSGFASALSSYGSGDWTRMAAFGVSADNRYTLNTSELGSSLSMSFDQSDARAGTWTVTNTDASNDVELDLVFAIHTGGGSGAWLFDALQIGAGETLSGTWALNLLNNGGKYSGYSNLTIFGRNFEAMEPAQPAPLPGTPAADVPEPGTWTSLFFGVGMLGFMRRRMVRMVRKQATM